MDKLIVIGNARPVRHKDTIDTAPTTRIGQLKLDLECSINGEYYDPLEIVSLVRSGGFSSSSISFDDIRHSSFPSSAEVIPLAGLYLSDLLKRCNYDVILVHNYWKEVERLKSEYDQDTFAVVISSTFLDFTQLLKVIASIRSFAPNVPIIVGGPGIVLVYRHLPFLIKFNSEDMAKVFLVTSAQGETSLLEVLRALKEKLPLSEVPNLYFLADRKWIATESRPEPIDSLQTAIDWDKLDPTVLRDIGYAPVQTSRGCPSHCQFCSYRTITTGLTFKPLEILENELRSIASQHPDVRHILFTDDNLSAHPVRFEKILAMLIRNSFPFTWSGMIRTSSVTPRTADMLRRSGCSVALLGVESFDQGMLERMQKGVTEADNRRAVALLREMNIFISAFIFIGFPGETKRSIEYTVNGILDTGIDVVEMTIWHNLPGTTIAEEGSYEITGIFDRWQHSTMNSVEAMEYLVCASDRLRGRFGTSHDNGLYCAFMKAQGLTNEHIRSLYDAKAELVLLNRHRREGSLLASSLHACEQTILKMLETQLQH